MIFNKKFLLIALVTMFAMLIFTPDSVQANQRTTPHIINVTIDGRIVNFTDQGPTIVDDRTLVPVRGVFEELGFEVDWEHDTQTVRLTGNGHEIVLTIASANFITNGESHTLDVPAQIIGGRTMLPIRAILESVGYSVGWGDRLYFDSSPVISEVRIRTSDIRQQITDNDWLLQHVTDDRLLQHVTDDEMLRIAESNHRLLVAAVTLYIEDNNGAMPSNTAALDYYMGITFAELNNPSSSSTALPASAQYIFASANDDQGRATVTITTKLNGQLVATWNSSSSDTQSLQQAADDAKRLRQSIDSVRLVTAEMNHRLLVSAVALYMADNNGAMPPNAEALDYYMGENTFAFLNGPSGPSTARPVGAQYSFTSGTNAQGRATITITTELNGQLIATWSP